MGDTRGVGSGEGVHMKVTYQDLPFPATGSGLHRSDDPHRPHLTPIIREIGQRTGLIKVHAADNGWDINFAGDIGFMWEDCLSLVMGDRMSGVARVGEVEMDGIVGSPDGIGPDPLGVHPAVLEEYKFTWKSSRNLPQSNWYWMMQVKCYCRMLGLTVCEMRIAYVMGDYKGGGPRYREARLEFTEGELEEAWGMVTKYAREKKGMLGDH